MQYDPCTAFCVPASLTRRICGGFGAGLSPLVSAGGAWTLTSSPDDAGSFVPSLEAPRPARTSATISTGTSLMTAETAAGAGLFLRLDLDQECVALAAARADRCEPEAAAVTPELVDHRREDPSAGGADGMSQGDRATVHVHPLRVDVEHPGRVHDHGREGLFQLDALDVSDRLARLVEGDPPGLRRRPGQVGEVVGHIALGEDRGEHLEAALLRVLLARHDEGAGAVADPPP